jgi:hypothetical protein
MEICIRFVKIKQTKLDGGAWQQALYFQVREYKPD